MQKEKKSNIRLEQDIYSARIRDLFSNRDVCRPLWKHASTDLFPIFTSRSATSSALSTYCKAWLGFLPTATVNANMGAVVFLHRALGFSTRNDCDAGNAPWLSCITGGDGITSAQSSYISEMNENTDYRGDQRHWIRDRLLQNHCR
jgi:hypothetical protein